MQTFLPFPSFADSARVLDSKRLGKQRVECKQILLGQWKNHPASKMWVGHSHHLALYGLAICDEWISRGYQDTCRSFMFDRISVLEDTGPPWWLGWSAYHVSHQSNLVRKFPTHYEELFPGVPGDLPYIWPDESDRLIVLGAKHSPT